MRRKCTASLVRSIVLTAVSWCVMFVLDIYLNQTIDGFDISSASVFLAFGTLITVGIPIAHRVSSIHGLEAGAIVLSGFVIAGAIFAMVQIRSEYRMDSEIMSLHDSSDDVSSDAGETSGSVDPNSQEKINGIPKSLVEFAEKYPEAEDFVSAYPREHAKTHQIDLRSEVKKGTIPLLIQWDKRWGYETYGDDFFAVTGCGPTCLSMVLCGLTGDASKDPLTIAKYSESSGYYVDGVGTSWDLMTQGAEDLGLQAEEGEVSEQYILENLSQQTPMIASMLPGDFTYSGHFIVLTGLNADGTISVNDPNSRKNSEKKWDPEKLIPQISALWKYEA